MPVYHLGLGVALHGLLSAGHCGVSPLASSVASKWLQGLEGGRADKETVSTEQVRWSTIQVAGSDVNIFTNI